MKLISFENFVEKYTGSIIWLREHPIILRRIYDRVCEDNVDISKINNALMGYAYTGRGGFIWSDTKEGHEFWENLFSGNTENFYNEVD